MKQQVVIENLRLKFIGEDSLRFKDLSLTINDGEKVLILGPSGCGKSTLLQVMCGLIPKVAEVPIKADVLRVPDQYGYVFQDPETQFCMPHIDEELAFVLENKQVPRRYMHERIKYWLSEVGLACEDPHIPIATLSGGMKQRLALATCLALEPDVLFMDEPSAMLDSKGVMQIWKTIQACTREKTVIIVEHHLEYVLSFIDRIILMNEKGEIVDVDSKEAILNKHGQWMIEVGIWHPGSWETHLNAIDLPLIVKGKEALVEMKNAVVILNNKPILQTNTHIFHSGEWVVIHGANGAGKSTFLQTIANLIHYNGEIYLNGNLTRNDKSIYDDLAYVFQNPELQFVTERVEDEVAFSVISTPIDDLSQENIDRNLMQYGLYHVKNKHPYDLSMGQKRRLSVAISTMHKPKVYLLDEPTFGQDAIQTFAILKHLEHERMHGALILMVSHDEQIRKHYATRTICIQNGRIITDEGSRRETGGEQ